MINGPLIDISLQQIALQKEISAKAIVLLIEEKIKTEDLKASLSAALLKVK
jgi:hypothetical protein